MTASGAISSVASCRCSWAARRRPCRRSPSPTSSIPVRSKAGESSMFREVSIGRYYEDAPQLKGQGIRSWITRGANFAIVCSLGDAGATLSGTNKDEQFIYALEGGVKV